MTERFTPFEDWPEHAQRAMREANEKQAAESAARIRANTPPPTVPVSEAMQRDARLQQELAALAAERGYTSLREVDALAPDELAPGFHSDGRRMVVPTDVLLEWAREHLQPPVDDDGESTRPLHPEESR